MHSYSMVTSQGSLTFLPSQSPSPHPTAPGEGRRESLGAARIAVPSHPSPPHSPGAVPREVAGEISKPGARLSKPALPLPRLPPSFLHHSLAPLRSRSPPPRAEEARQPSQKTPRNNKTPSDPHRNRLRKETPRSPCPASAVPSLSRARLPCPPNALAAPAQPPPLPAAAAADTRACGPPAAAGKVFPVVPRATAQPQRGGRGGLDRARAPKSGAGSEGRTEGKKKSRRKSGVRGWKRETNNCRIPLYDCCPYPHLRLPRRRVKQPARETQNYLLSRRRSEAESRPRAPGPALWRRAGELGPGPAAPGRAVPPGRDPLSRAVCGALRGSGAVAAQAEPREAARRERGGAAVGATGKQSLKKKKKKVPVGPDCEKERCMI